MFCPVKIRTVEGTVLNHLLRDCLRKHHRTQILRYAWLKFSWQKDVRCIFKWQFVYPHFGWPGTWGQRYFGTSHKYLDMAPHPQKCVLNTFLFFFSRQAAAFGFSCKLLLNPLFPFIEVIFSLWGRNYYWNRYPCYFHAFWAFCLEQSGTRPYREICFQLSAIRSFPKPLHLWESICKLEDGILFTMLCHSDGTQSPAFKKQCKLR